jgi:signal transduction histidine kinase
LKQRFLWQAPPLRALLEAWLVAAALLLPLPAVVLPAPPLPRSLYLILLPLMCALIAGLRLRFFKGSTGWAVLKEIGFAVLLALGVTGLVFGVVAALGELEAVHYSSASTTGTLFFLLFSAAEFLGVRLLSWAWLRWAELRRRRFVWALTHGFLSVVWLFALLALTAFLVYAAALLGADIWGIPPDSLFARTVFWISAVVLVTPFVFLAILAVFLPPTALVSFLTARRMTARLERLAAGARALRQGDLATRVTVDGEDELAQLQADFNAMAADLERTVRELQTEKDKVWQLLEDRRELTAGISHELRNPAAIIQGYTDALRRGWQAHSPAEIQHDLETIQYETARLQTILDDLLTASQAEAGKLKLELQPVDVSAAAARLVETFQPLAWGSKRVQVSLSAPAQPVTALADPLRLEQALVNLVQNALRHTSPGGLVALEITRQGNRACIAVEDTGEGIAVEDLAHIWEKYYRGGSPRHGAGLGLSLVKELIEGMGGSVSVESHPGEGTLFSISLPGQPK